MLQASFDDRVAFTKANMANVMDSVDRPLDVRPLCLCVFACLCVTAYVCMSVCIFVCAGVCLCQFACLCACLFG